MDKVCVSIGAVYHIAQDKNAAIQQLGKLTIDGIELLFRDYDSLKSFELSEESLKVFENLRFRSIHAPWHDITYDSSGAGKQALDLLLQLYRKIGARNIVFHANNVPDYSLITSLGFSASTENSDWRMPHANTTIQISSLLQANSRLSLTLDIAHALTISPHEALNYVDGFRDRIVQCHVASAPVVPDHSFLHEHDSEGLRNILRQVKQLDVPVVIESVVPEGGSIDLIAKEVEYLRAI